MYNWWRMSSGVIIGRGTMSCMFQFLTTIGLSSFVTDEKCKHVNPDLSIVIFYEINTTNAYWFVT